MATPNSDLRALPLGNLDPLAHPTLERGFARLGFELTALKLGYVEQLYTFGDSGRDPTAETPDRRLISISYLALTSASALAGQSMPIGAIGMGFSHGKTGAAAARTSSRQISCRALEAWTGNAEDAAIRDFRRDRVAMAFGGGRISWDPARTLDRYELLYEANLVDESRRVPANVRCAGKLGQDPVFGQPMARDHRRVLATAISRLRGKLTYRPVVFELIPESFTLLQLQRMVETLAGIRLHKQNFRRLVDRGGLVEPTGKRETRTGGRPAEHYRFRRKVLSERPAPGVGLPERRT